MNSFPTTETTFLISGPVGNIELLATPAPTDKIVRNAVAIICHPHPLHGGTMHNKVVSTLARTFRDLGLPSIRFNFRGVGKTEGSYDEGKGETEDLLAIVDWVKMAMPNMDIWLAGFSFGAYVSARAATQIPIAQLVSIAPQASRFVTDHLPPITCPWVLVQGEQDEVVSPEEVYQWIETLEYKPVLIKMPGAGHFFHGRLMELRQKLEDFLKQRF